MEWSLFVFYIVNLLQGFPKGLSHTPRAVRDSRKIAKIRISIYTLYRPHTLDDDEGERKADGDPKSDRDESAASAPSIVTTDRKNREDAAPNSTIERDRQGLVQ